MTAIRSQSDSRERRAPEALAQIGDAAARDDAEHSGDRAEEQSPGPARRQVPGGAVRRVRIRDIPDFLPEWSRLRRQGLHGGRRGQEKEGQAEQGGLQARHKVCDWARKKPILALSVQVKHRSSARAGQAPRRTESSPAKQQPKLSRGPVLMREFPPRQGRPASPPRSSARWPAGRYVRSGRSRRLCRTARRIGRMAVAGLRLPWLLYSAVLALSLPACVSSQLVPAPSASPAEASGGLTPPEDTPRGASAPRSPQSDMLAQSPDFWDRLDVDVDLVRDDLGHFYSMPILVGLGLGVGVAALL